VRLQRRDARRYAKSGHSPYTPPQVSAAPDTVALKIARIKTLEGELAKLQRKPASRKGEQMREAIKQELDTLYCHLHDQISAESYDAPTVDVAPAQEVSATEDE
jgi:hypothetical protein